MGKSKHSERTNGVQYVIKESKAILKMSQIFRTSQRDYYDFPKNISFAPFCETKYWAV